MIPLTCVIYTMAQMYLSRKQKENHREHRRVVAEQEEEEEGWTGSLGLVQANYSI